MGLNGAIGLNRPEMLMTLHCEGEAKPPLVPFKPQGKLSWPLPSREHRAAALTETQIIILHKC